MKKNIYLAVVLLASLVLGACRDDDDNSSGYTEKYMTEAPVWQIDWSNNQERPDWTEPDAGLYENWTILKVQIEDELMPYVSDGDLMALFINGELRGLASPAVPVSGNQEINGKFLLKAYGNESGTETVNMSLQYYNSTLKHIFSLTDDITLDSDVTTGIDEDFIPEFTYGAAKYPVVKAVGVETILSKVGLTPVSGNMVGAFVGDECRGKAVLSASGTTTLVIYGRTEGESVSLKYYDPAEETLYTLPDALSM